MQSNLYVSLSGQLSLLKRLETVANNVANLSTPGYRAERISFEEALSKSAAQNTSFVSEGRTHISTAAGPMEKTGNPLDIAVNGDAWFGINTPGGTAYTRDGRMSLSTTGELLSVQGFTFVDAGGSPLQIDANGPPPTIGRDGSIVQGERTLGRIGLFTIRPDAALKRSPNGSVTSNRPAEPALDFNSVSVAQGFIERSNSNPVMEMTRLISIQRTFDAITNVVSDTEEGLANAIRTLGS
ncbi:MAG: flagellar basal-body rod protein FlgF [Hyphomicrobium sp.]|jgi:flagellar basal-body rod protein FlgF|nr:flagellar basal-body rod protein FlgF [Hyphomicrobium sp.]